MTATTGCCRGMGAAGNKTSSPTPTFPGTGAGKTGTGFLTLDGGQDHAQGV